MPWSSVPLTFTEALAKDQETLREPRALEPAAVTVSELFEPKVDTASAATGRSAEDAREMLYRPSTSRTPGLSAGASQTVRSTRFRALVEATWTSAAAL